MPLYEHVFLARQDLAQAQVDALKQNYFHVERSLLHDVGKQADVARALDRTG